MALNKKKLGLLAIIGLLLFSISMLTGCSSDSSEDNITGKAVTLASTDESSIVIDKLEIYHFHGTNQCRSCIAIGDYAEETVYTYFAREVESGTIVFDHINGELPEHKELVIKYGATGSSLWLGTYKGEEFTAEQNTKVWYKIQDKDDYMTYLKEVIEQKLAGN